MKRKIFVLVMTLVMILTTITVQNDINAEANDEDNDPGIDHTYIYKKTKKLSEIIENELYEWRSREFGTLGENKAADDIEYWMENLGLYNPHQELIDEEWTKDDTWNKKKDNYVGDLQKKREFDEDDYYLNIRVYDRNMRFITGKDFDNDNCFPFLKGWYLGGPNVGPINNVRVVDEFDWDYKGRQIVYIENEEWSPHPYDWNTKLLGNGILTLRCKGFILGDYFSDTWFMQPSHKDHKKILANHLKAGFSITGDDGDWLEQYIGEDNEDDYIVLASLKSRCQFEDMTSYNVIGQINGTDIENVSIVVAHYDCWWSQGTIDEGAETALVLGIAKYIQDNNLTLKNTVKFITTGGEEIGFRGIKDYIKEHIIQGDENVLYVINPGNFGHEDRIDQEGNDLKFEFASERFYLHKLANMVTDGLNFVERTQINTKTNYELGGEDGKIFSKTGTDEGTIIFSRFPYKMYHRGGESTSDGDVMDILDNESFEIESEVVTSIAMHLIVDSEHRFENVSINPYDSSGDGNNDSVNAWFNLTTDTNTTLFGRVKGCLYDSNGNKIYLSEKKSPYYLLNKNSSIAGNLKIRLPSFKPCDTYSVHLSIVDYFDDVDDEYNESVYLYPYSKAVSDFESNITSLKARSFTDNSTPSPNASIVSWNWSFGDGNYSNQQNTSHTFYDNGNYTVTLTVGDSNNLSNTSNMTISVDNAVPSVSICVASNVQIAGDTMSFNTSAADSDGSITNYSWDFGDNSTDNSAGPSHTYSKSGLYIVNLTVTDDDGATNYTTKTMIVAGALVDDSYQQDDPQNHSWDTVQEAINDVNDYDIIYINNGNYSESITVNRSISLYGASKEQVTIQSIGTVIDIVNESVFIDGFTIDGGTTNIQLNSVNNCSITNCIVNGSVNGIRITSGADNNTISKCYFTNNSYGVFVSGAYNWIGSQNMDQLCNDSFFTLNRYGIYIDDSQGNMIVGCNINATPGQSGGPPLASYGICLDDSENNTVICSEIYDADNNGYGVYLDDSENNYICHNIIEENDYGVFLTSSSDNRIAMNNISNNDLSGVTITMMSSSNNSIHWNDFYWNGHLIYPQASDDGSGNLWNTSGNETLNYVSTGEGNYWSDYIGSDSEGDGIGDTSYQIFGIANAVDSYPVMKANNYEFY